MTADGTVWCTDSQTGHGAMLTAGNGAAVVMGWTFGSDTVTVRPVVRR
ncbi:MAG: hypothetical protein ACREL5_05645 [Gemmatimonadales bacterium]